MPQNAIYFSRRENQDLFQMEQNFSNLVAQNASLTQRLGQKQAALDMAQQEICNLKEGIYGSDWQLRQDDAENRIWITDGKKHEVLVEAAIKRVLAYSLRTSDGTQFAFSVSFQLNSGVKAEVFLSQRDLESSSVMMSKLEQAGIYTRTKRSDKLKSCLLKRLVLERISEVILLPEYAGWNGNVFCFVDSKGVSRLKGLGFSAPSLIRVFPDLRLQPPILQRGVRTLFSHLGKETASLLMAVTAGSLLFTPLKEKGYVLDFLFALAGEVYDIQGVRRWMQPWRDELCVSLQKKRNVAKALNASKDEVFFLLDEGTKYSLNLAAFLNTLGRAGDLESDGKIKQLKSVPLLITGRSAVWRKKDLSFIELPFVNGIEGMQTDKNMAADFWHSFCDFLNSNYGFLNERLGNLRFPAYAGSRYQNVYNWIATSYDIFAPFLEMVIGTSESILSVQDFLTFVAGWLQGVEQQDEMEISDYFIFCLEEEKKANRIEFVRSSTLFYKQNTELVFVADNEYIYISAENFATLVRKFLPGCSEREVYTSLAEEGSAKMGDSGHLFPKCPLKMSRDGIRQRMAHIKRSLLLSDSELLLEV